MRGNRKTVKRICLILILMMWGSTALLQDTAGAETPDSHSFLVAGDQTQQDAKEEDLSFLEDDQNEKARVSIPDPLYGFNKAMYHVNDKLYFWVLKPTATVWKTVTPEMLRIGIKNFFYNLRFPIRFVNCLLQGKGKRAEAEFNRFLINTIIGVGGIGNPARSYPQHDPPQEDLGQTFAAWGIDNGFYHVVPLIGPTTLRDGLGMVGDLLLDPTFWLGLEVDNLWVTMGIYTGETINSTTFRIGDYEAVKQAAVDPYVAIRNGYIQNRNKLIEE